MIKPRALPQSYSLPNYPGTHSVDQAGLKLRNPPASASHVLGIKACTTMPSITSDYLFSLQ